MEEEIGVFWLHKASIIPNATNYCASYVTLVFNLSEPVSNHQIENT